MISINPNQTKVKQDKSQDTFWARRKTRKSDGQKHEEDETRHLHFECVTIKIKIDVMVKVEKTKKVSGEMTVKEEND